MRKEHVARWAAPPAERTADKAEPKRPVRMIDLPGVRKLEDKLLLYSSTRGDPPPEFADIAAETTKATFGATWADTEYQLPDHYWDLPEGDAEKERMSDLWWQHEGQFEVAGMSEAEVVEHLLRLGLDFTDEAGRPLRCLGAMARVAEAAAKGIVGTVPSAALADLSSWEAKMMEEAARFRKARKA